MLAALGASALAAWLLSLLFSLAFLTSAIAVAVVITAVAAVYSYNARVKVIRDFPEKGMVNRHWSAWRFKHYDRFLDRRVRYARTRRLSMKRGRPSQEWNGAAGPT